MLRQRTSLLVALLAVGSTSLAMAQTAPPNNGASSPDTQSTDPSTNSNGSMSSEAPADRDAPADKMSAQDPKMKQCVKSEKAKNSGQSDNQIKQKCMLQIGSHQGE
jgi:hypothetical protein